MKIFIYKTVFQVKSLYILLFLVALCGLISCDKFVEIDRPQDKLLTSEIFSSDETALSGMYGIHAHIGRGSSGMLAMAHSISGLTSDELLMGSYFELDEQYQNNSIMPSNGNLRFLWTDAYKVIYYVNSMLEGLNASSSVTEETKNQLMGECYFLRALEYFMLVNFYGDVPLITGTDYLVNYNMARSPVADVYTKIEADLELAITLLGYDYPVSQRIRPNRAAAKALLARVKLYRNDAIGAETLATEIISDPRYLLEEDLNKVFLVNSREAIWQVYPTDNNTYDTPMSTSFIPNGNRIPSYVLSQHLLDDFEPDDQRRAKWTGKVTVGGTDYFHIYKYKIRTKPSTTPPTEYFTPLRLAEQYLIRAEARAMQNKIEDAMEDVNTIRQRAGLPSITNVTTKEECVMAILQERRIELMVEFGHRWFDLKRLNLANPVLSGVKGSFWQPTDALYPIHEQDLATSLNLTQNPGYN